ncbi:hypothetical protein T12_10647 [Trichinella patagoniensis]|uniref:Uncharacterized protein n=1 Tax=Trichinella patagoniensis TaxID=990121 RepID=A0A0V1A0C7_9BILA|nr:hypothetical protein T12_10647 [Trichinella patagoniensis]
MPKAKKLPLLASGLGRRRRSPSINRFPAFFSPSLEHLQNLSIVGRGKKFFCFPISNIQFQYSTPNFRHVLRCCIGCNDAYLGSRQDGFNEVTGDASLSRS